MSAMVEDGVKRDRRPSILVMGLAAGASSFLVGLSVVLIPFVIQIGLGKVAAADLAQSLLGCLAAGLFSLWLTGPCALFLFVPMLVILRRLTRLGLWELIATGYVAAFLYQILLDLILRDGFFSLGTAIVLAFLGAIGAFIFWCMVGDIA